MALNCGERCVRKMQWLARVLCLGEDCTYKTALPTCHYNRGLTELHGQKFIVYCILEFLSCFVWIYHFHFGVIWWTLYLELLIALFHSSVIPYFPVYQWVIENFSSEFLLSYLGNCCFKLLSTTRQFKIALLLLAGMPPVLFVITMSYLSSSIMYSLSSFPKNEIKK